MDRKIDIIDIKNRLSARSDFFCPAKWTELFLYLNHGNSNSCHHPLPHQIPSELLSDPYVLHNTPHKLEQQRLMLSGERPAECHMCWHIEDTSENAVSDRFIKAHQWQEHLEELEIDPHYVPRSIEVVFDNLCNLNCSYCDSGQSSSWAARIDKNPMLLESDYRELYRTIHIKPGTTKSEYMNAWLRWWPEIAQKVKILKISGGEPLISPNFWQFFDVLGHCPTLRFSINSNLSVDQHRLEAFANKATDFQSIEISASIDARGDLARYVRKGLNFDLFVSNCDYWCTHTPENCVLFLQATVNILSVWGFDEFLDLVRELRRRYPGRIATCYATLVRFPEFQSVSLLPRGLRAQLADKIQKVLNAGSDCFDDIEQSYINKIITYLRNEPVQMQQFDPAVLRRDLRLFLARYDSFDHLQYSKVLPSSFVSWLDCGDEIK